MCCLFSSLSPFSSFSSPLKHWILNGHLSKVFVSVDRADLFTRHILACILRSHLGSQENWELFHNSQPSIESTLHCLCCLHRVYKIFRFYRGIWRDSFVTSILKLWAAHGQGKWTKFSPCLSNPTEARCPRSPLNKIVTCNLYLKNKNWSVCGNTVQKE